MAAYQRGRRSDADRVERTYQRTSGNRRRKSASRQRNNNLILIIITLLVVVAAIITGLVLFSDKDDGLILANVSVAGVDVSRMTKEDAITAVRLATENTYGKNNMVVQVNDQKEEISPSASGVSLNVEDAVEAAYKLGRTGSSKDKAKDKLNSATGIVVDIIPYLNLNQNAIQSALDKLAVHYSSILTQTTYKVIGDYSPTSSSLPVLEIVKGTPEYNLDMDALLADVLDAYNNNRFSVEVTCNAIQPDALDLQAIYDEHCVPPTDAVVDPYTFEVTPAVPGCGFDINEVQTALDNAAPGERLSFTFKMIKGNSTESDKLYKDILGRFTATAEESDADRNVNLKKACDSINGTILMPGDVFSYNKALGERTEANGYRPGPSYAGNDTVDTVGGGICQVSSALYYCVLVADLGITERDYHGFYPGYVPLGMDAVVSWNSLDFKFYNNTNFPIRIDAEASGGSVTVSIMGTDEKDYEIKMEYDILKTYNHATTYKTMSANNPEGYKDGDEIVKGYTGYDVEVFKCKYDKESGELISRDKVDSSHYRSRDAVICKIDAPQEEETTPTTPPGMQGTGGGISPDE